MMTSTAPAAAEELLESMSVPAGTSVAARTVSLPGARVGVRIGAGAGVASAAVSEVAELMINPKQASKRGRRRTIRFIDEGARIPKWFNTRRLGHREEKGKRSLSRKPTQRGTALRRGEAESDADPQDVEFGGRNNPAGRAASGRTKDRRALEIWSWTPRLGRSGSHEFQLSRSKDHHAQEKPAMAPALNVRFAIGALAVTDGDVGDLQIEFGRAEEKVEVAEGVEVAEVSAVGGNFFVVGAAKRFSAAKRVLHGLA